MTLPKKWVIYKMTNPVGQVYIGRTSSLKSRLLNYKNLNGRTKGQPFLYWSLLQHGFEHHIVDILEEGIRTEKEGKAKEMFWVRTYMSNSIKWPEQKGLNRTDGGQGANGLIHADDSKLKTNPPRKGQPVGDIQRTALSKSWGRTKPVAKYSMEGILIAEYPSVKEAQKANNICAATLWKSLKGIHHPNVIFKYI